MTYRGRTLPYTLMILKNKRSHENDRVKFEQVANKENLLWESYTEINFLLCYHVFKQIFFIQEEENRRVLEDIFPVDCEEHK
jgi:hypothetical protein